VRRRAAIGVAAALLLLGGATFAEGERPEGASGEEAAACEASSSDEQCAEFWESHINWWSWDYKAGPTQQAEHRHMPPPFGFALINFAVFAMIMYRLAARPLREFVRTRHLTIKNDLDEAAKLKAEADAKLGEYQKRIAGIDKEVQDLIAQVRAEAEAEKQRLVAQAAEHAKRLAAEAEAQIKTEIARARAQLRREAVEAAMATAEGVLREKLSTEDQKRLADRFVGELEGAKVAAGARS
jgi:F-type H+-transporting ATPase subunit b